MPFQVTDRAPPRFDRDFDISPIAATAPTADETALLASFGAAKDAIVAGRAADDAEQLRQALADARRRWWSANAASVREAADRFVQGTDDVAAATQRLAAIEAERVRTRPDIVIENLSVDQARFKGDFRVSVANCPLDDAERGFLTTLDQALRFLAGEAAADRNADGSRRFPDSMLSVRRDLREKAAADLAIQARYFREGTAAATLTTNIAVIRGEYKGVLARLAQPLFTVSVESETVAGRQYAVDLDVRVDQGLPAPNDVVSPEKQELYVALSNALTVIATVCQQIREQATQPYRIDAIEAADKRARQLLDEYVSKLAGIGRLGLEGPHTPLAKLALISLKAEFSAREAGRIKNNYVRKLGRSAAWFAAAFVAAYVLIRLAPCPLPEGSRLPFCASDWWGVHKTFLLAAGGASVGTWLSFAVRRLDLPFEDLALLDEHSLDPPFRILFVVALTLLACLLFWTQTINISIGGLNTSPDNFRLTGSIAVVVGLFCGLSERALAAAMSNRAAGFVGGLVSGR